MKKSITVTGMMLAKVVSILGTACVLGMIIAKLFGFVEVDTAVLILFLVVNVSTLSLAFARKG